MSHPSNVAELTLLAVKQQDTKHHCEGHMNRHRVSPGGHHCLTSVTA